MGATAALLPSPASARSPGGSMPASSMQAFHPPSPSPSYRPKSAFFFLHVFMYFKVGGVVGEGETLEQAPP